MYRITLPALAAATLLACASKPTPPIEPHSMSETEHAAAAKSESSAAAAHSAEYDPTASKDVTHCSGGTASSKFADVPCWTETLNPTAAHLEEAKAHAKLAAEHRAASKVLADAEAKACAGISDVDRDMSPFHHRDDIAKVTFAGPAGNETSATIVFKSTPGLTAASLQKIVDCHLARNAALGHVVPEMSYCPLVPKGVKATVSMVDSALVVVVTDDDASARKDVIARLKKLLAP